MKLNINEVFQYVFRSSFSCFLL